MKPSSSITKLMLIASMTLATVFALSIAAPAPAEAQVESSGCDDDADSTADDAGSFRKIVRNGETIYEFTGVIRVCGKVPKPNVVVILLEKTIGYEWDRLKQEFLPKIRESLKKAPF